MKFVNILINTDLVPKKIYHYKKLRIIIYPSTIVFPASGHSEKQNGTGLIIYAKNRELTKDYIRTHLKKFYMFFQFLHHSSSFFVWYVNTNLLELAKDVFEYKSLNNFLKENAAKEYSKISGIYKHNNIYDNFGFFVHGNMYNAKIPTEEYLQKFMRLSESDKLYNQINLFSIIDAFQFPLNRLYSNDGVKISLLFTIIDSLFDDLHIKEESEKKCPNCGFPSKRKITMKEKLKQFSKGLSEFKENDQKLLLKILWKHYQTRNKVYHEAGIFDSSNEAQQIIKKLGGDYISLIDEVNHSESASLSGYMVMKEIVQIQLLKKLAAVRMEEEHDEFFL